jgi:hypothetical protein
MSNRTLLTLFALASLSISVPASIPGPSPRSFQDQSVQSVKEKIRKKGTGERAKVTVKLFDQTTHKGYIREANENDFVLIDRTGGPHTIRYADVKSLSGGGLSGVGKYALGIALGVVAVIAVVAAIAASDD